MPSINIVKLRTGLVDWYGNHCRRLPWRHSTDPYAIWISEVMLQQTQVKTVIPYYNRFIKNFPTVQSLAAADLQEVLKIWEGLGYYARARNLHRAAIQVTRQNNGVLPNDWKGLRALAGVGDYIAAAVLSIAFDQPYAVVDGNVKRVLARMFTMAQPVNKSSYHKAFQAKADDLLDSLRPGTFNQAIMELGALICMPRQPDCAVCPIKFACKAFASGKIADYPKREKKPPIPEYRIAIGVVQKNGRILITRRKPDGLLGGLWEFPGGKINADESPTEALIREIAEETALMVDKISFLTRIRHAYTHFKIEADVFICDYTAGKVRLNGPSDYRWIDPAAIKHFPFPKANHKFIPLLMQRLEAKSDDQNNPFGST